MPAILATLEAENRKIEIQSQPGQIVFETICQKYPTQKRACGVPRVVECLPSKCKALSLNPSTEKINKKEKT
jgi:hypothetical protein